MVLVPFDKLLHVKQTDTMLVNHLVSVDKLDAWVWSVHIVAAKNCHQYRATSITRITMTLWTGNVFRVTGPFWGEFTGHRWIPLTKASDAVDLPQGYFTAPVVIQWNLSITTT